MSSGDIAVLDLSRSVHPAENDAGRELLDHLSMDPNLQTTYQNLEMMKRMLTTRFSDESLIFVLQKLQEIQQGPSFQQYWHFIHDYEGIKYLKKSLAEITGENVNLRIEKESDKRCLKVLLKELRNRSAHNNEVVEQLVMANEQLTTEKEEFVTRNEQLATEKDQLATERDQLATQYGQLVTEKDQLATEKDQLATEREQMDYEIRKLKAENARKDTLIVKMMTGMVQVI